MHIGGGEGLVNLSIWPAWAERGINTELFLGRQTEVKRVKQETPTKIESRGVSLYYLQASTSWVVYSLN